MLAHYGVDLRREDDLRRVWMLLKGLPSDAAVWREENAAFAGAKEGQQVMVSRAWSLIFRREPVRSSPDEVERFFADAT